LVAKTARPLDQAFFLVVGCGPVFRGSPIGSNLDFGGGGTIAGIGLLLECYFLLKISSACALLEDPDIKVAFFTDLDYFEIRGRS
tara:strand:- start:135 stop:389 length:255 start_codon:yes stop_codon:yes gene_type:complete